MSWPCSFSLIPDETVVVGAAIQERKESTESEGVSGMMAELMCVGIKETLKFG